MKLFILLLTIAAAGLGQGFEVLEVQPNVHVIAGAGSNIVVQSGADGVVLVGAGAGPESTRVIDAIRRLSSRPIRYIIDCNADEDHVGGNMQVSRAGQTINPPTRRMNTDFANIIAHENVLNRLSADPKRPADAMPTDTFFRRRKPMYLNAEGIQIIHEPAAHSDGDSIVYFRRSDVIAAGAIIDTEHFPAIDPARGGTIQGEIDALNELVEMAIPSIPLLGQATGTVVVPGHGRLMDQLDVVEYRDMVTIIRDRIVDLMRKGQTLDQIRRTEPAKGYVNRYGPPDAFIEAIFRTSKVN